MSCAQQEAYRDATEAAPPREPAPGERSPRYTEGRGLVAAANKKGKM